MNTGTGLFGAPQSLSVTRPYALLAGSFNADGYEDVIVGLLALPGPSGLLLLPGSTSGFGTPMLVPMSAGIWNLSGGDFDASGTLDVAAIDTSWHLTVLSGDGAGALTSVVELGVGEYSGSSAGDVTGDGRDDLVVSNGRMQSVIVLHATPGGWFDTAARYPLGGLVRDSVSADFDADGHPDVAVSTYDSVAILLNDGRGGFALTASLPAGPAARALAAADWNGDGRLDLAVANVYGDDLSMFLGHGDGTFRVLADAPAGRTPWAIAAGDLDGDARHDLAVLDGHDRASILLGNGDGTFRAAAPVVVGSSPEDVALPDLDADGDLDLVIARGTAGDIAVALGNGDGTFQPSVGYAAGQYPASLATGDWNGDGLPDLAASSSPDDRVSVFLGAGGGGLVPVPALQVPDAAALAAGDFDADASTDLAVIHTGRAALGVLRGSGTGTFQAVASYEAGTGATSLAAGDFDGDGATDLGVTDAGADQLRVLLSRLLIIEPPTLPAGTAGVPYAETLSARLGTSPYDFVLARGALPPGLALGPAGDLSGIPSTPGTFGFTARATDARGCADEHAFMLTIDGGTPRNLLAGAGAGPPSPNRVRAFLQDGTPAPVDVAAYGAGAWGVGVGTGDTDGAGAAEILTGPGPGASFGPQVRAFLRDATPIPRVNFHAYGTLRYGVNVEGGDVESDGFAEILTGAGPGAVFGPHVRGFDHDGGSVSPAPGLGYYAYATLKYGATVAAGDLDGDGGAEILTGPGPGPTFAPQIRGWDYTGSAVTAIARVNFNAFPVPGYGVETAAGDVDADGPHEIAATPGPGPSLPPRFVGFAYDGARITALPGLDVTTSALRGYGGRVGLGDVSGDGRADLVSGLGRDPAADSVIAPYVYLGGVSTPLYRFEAFPGGRYGVDVIAADLRY